MNRAEEFVANLCKSSFLSLWSYPNPQGRNGKELCDFLVVCDPDVIVFSVKEIKVGDSGDVKVDWDRWRRRAIEESVRQIYGAERFIKERDAVVTRDGDEGLRLPDLEHRRVHRVAVALGGEGKVPLSSGDFGKGYVHVFDEQSFGIIIQELDTITDFVNYLRAKEELADSGINVLLEGGGEEDLLAFYIDHGRSFPTNHDTIFLGSDLWASISQKPAFKAKKDKNGISYVWDELIEILCRDHLAGRLLGGLALDDVERTVRIMARENRFARRILGKGLLNLLDLSKRENVRARLMPSPGGTPYVVLACPAETPREDRKAELAMRCHVARGKYLDQKTVIGIATERPRVEGFSLDVIYFHKDTWTGEDQATMDKIQEKLGYFADPLLRRVQEDEYPLAGE